MLLTRTSSTLDQNDLELANKGKQFFIRATNIFGNAISWVTSTPGFAVIETLSVALGGITAIERIDAGGSNSKILPTKSGISLYYYGGR